MSNPNITIVSGMYGNTVSLIPTGTSATAWTALTPATNVVNKINYISASNVTGSSAAITVSINNAINGGGTAVRLVYQVTVPANASLIITDKSTTFYLGESQSIVVTSGTTNAIEMIASYEALS